MITVDRVDELLSDDFVAEIATRHIKGNLNVVVLGRGVRDAVRDLLEYVPPSHVREEIDYLRSAGERSDLELALRTLSQLSSDARRILGRRRIMLPEPAKVTNVASKRSRQRLIMRKVELPTVSDFDDPARREAAFEALRVLATSGGHHPHKPDSQDPDETIRAGRWKPHLNAPAVSRGREPRVETRQFVASMRLSYMLAHPDHVAPAMTANHENKGPFARLLQEILDRIDARHIDVVEAILANASHRRKIDQDRNRPA